jgi:hypothetical protein
MYNIIYLNNYYFGNFDGKLYILFVEGKNIVKGAKEVVDNV